MTGRLLPEPMSGVQGQRLVGDEPVLLHCNFYNYWLQKTVTLVEDLGMEQVCIDAAARVTYSCLSQVAATLSSPEERLRMAADLFSQNGFGRIDFSHVDAAGGRVTTPVSHYGQMFLAAAEVQRFAVAQNYFDRGFAAGAVAAAYDLPPEAFITQHDSCYSVGDSVGAFLLARREGSHALLSTPGPGKGDSAPAPAPHVASGVDEPAVLQALSGLDLSGNEEGLVPRFGVMLTHHFGNYYNLISFEFARRMRQRGTLPAAESLLVDAGHHCAFHTFGGIMTSAEWDAVVRPMCKTREDWVAGISAVINALGWGVWRVQELSESRLVMRVYDDYESRGYLGAYGAADRPVCYLATGGVAGIMNLVYAGDIASGPQLSAAYYEDVFNSELSFDARQTMCLASGDPYSEFVAER